MPEQSEEEKAAMVANQVNKVDSLLTTGDSAAVLGAVGTIAAAISQPSADETSEESSEAAPSQEEQKKLEEVRKLTGHSTRVSWIT